MQTPVVQIALTGEDFVNVTWNVNGNNDAPAGSIHYIKYRKSGKNTTPPHLIHTQHQVPKSGNKYHTSPADSIRYIKYWKSGNNATHPQLVPYVTSNMETQVIMLLIPSWFHTLHQKPKLR